ncbi:MAG: FtsX-like permease family protein [Planctomycetes bacterium]|nr:FtsX-like permease family protein [Planctomycetota bacterium]
MFKHFFTTFRLGIHSLLLHKLRSFLAIVGILIGITAVIWLVAMGEGASFQAQQQIKDLGANNIIIISQKPASTSSSSQSALFIPYGLLREDYQRIITNVPFLEQAVPMREIKREVRYGAATAEARLVGCTPEYYELNHLVMYRGRFLKDRDAAPPDNVCVVAEGVAEALFGFANPIGKSIQIDRDFYQVVGETSRRDPTAAIGGSMDSQDYNLDVYIPLGTLRARIGDMVLTSRSGSREGEVVELSQITVSVPDLALVDQTADVIRTLIDKYHKVDDVKVVVPKELLRQAEVIRMIFNLLLILIAGISLVVGGIGIMNIMLATVTERTREIGIRRALGATRRAIIHQFLIEAVVLTGVGGTLGVAFGFLITPLVEFSREFATKMFPDVMNTLPPIVVQLQPRIANWSIIVSLLISIGVGLGFGLYPAMRAARMDPIEALRHE